MSFRLIFILTVERKDSESSVKCALLKTYPTVEKQVALLEGESYVPLPARDELTSIAAFALGIEGDKGKFSPTRDGCNQEENKPVFELRSKRGLLWPAIMIELSGLIFGALVSVPGKIREMASPFEFTNGVGIAHEFLNELGKHFSSRRRNNELDACVMDALMFLATVCPFGQPICVDSTFSDLLLQIEGEGSVAELQKTPVPVWRLTTGVKGNTRIIQINIKETVSGLQHEGQSGSSTEMSVSGLVTCLVQVLGGVSEVSLTLSCVSDEDRSRGARDQAEGSNRRGSILTGRVDRYLHHCLHHASCTYTDYRSRATSQTTSSQENAEGATSIQLRFHPPPQPFNLLAYSVTQGNKQGICSPPIAGFYHMQVLPDRRASLLLKLRLADEMPREFKRLEILLPFPNRPSLIDIARVTVSQGSFRIADNNRHLLVWDLNGTLRQREVTLSGEVLFHDRPSKHPLRDPFCIHQNVYAQVNFVLSDFTFSSLSVDQRSVLCSSDSGAKLVVNREFVSHDYRIWNSLGDAPTEYRPDSIPQELTT